MRIVAIAGSLRQGSYNRSLLFNIGELLPEGMAIEIQPIADVPLFNQDDEAKATPEAVARLREAVKAADGLLVATPEYNAGVPGVLKNTIDWLSRPAGKNELVGKPIAIVGATPGALGTARAQAQLRAAFEFNAAPVMPSPQVFVSQARDKFDADGRLTDEKTRTFLRKFMEAYAVWVRRFTTPDSER
jgi:chromate reductase, NAD(P)H dehydrogenase (quinone)